MNQVQQQHIVTRNGLRGIISPPGPLYPRPTDEIWAPMDTLYEFRYEISSYGMVRRFRLSDIEGKSPSWPAIRQNERGHLELQIYCHGQNKQYTIASTVLLAFVGPRPRGQYPRFRDGSFTNCTLPNLFWGTKLDQLIAENEYKERAIPTLQHQPGCPKLYGGSCGCNPTHLKEKQTNDKD